VRHVSPWWRRASCRPIPGNARTAYARPSKHGRPRPP
jgi:hypothetical protein